MRGESDGRVALAIASTTDRIHGMVMVGMDGMEEREFLDLDDAAWDLDLSMNLGTGVAVNSVLPRWIATGSQTEEEGRAGLYTPVGRSGPPEEVGASISFLASDRASYVTGRALVVDGGNIIKEAKGP